MLPKPEHCKNCALHTLGKGFMRVSGTGANGVMLVGESLGEDEVTVGLPFQGKAGKTLDRNIHRGAMKREDFWVANVVWCQPPGNKLTGMPWGAAAIKHCAPYLDHEIAKLKPKVVVALGSVAMHRLLPDIEVGLLNGARGYVFWSGRYNCWVLPTVHPSFIARGQTAWSQVLIYDLQHAVEIAANGYSYAEIDYTLDCTPSEAMKWVSEFESYALNNPDLFLSCDIETPDKDENEEDLSIEDSASYVVARCGYSYRAGHGLSIPWSGSFAAVHERLLGSPWAKVFWNAPFDCPRIETAGVHIEGQIHDAMDAWHVLNSDLKKSLGFVAPFFAKRYPMWKHTGGKDPAKYNCMDADVAGINMRGTVALLHEKGLWPIYQEFIVELDPVFAAMTKAGMPISAERRVAASQKLQALKEAVRAQIQAAVPTELRPLSPQEGYKVVPKDLSGLERRIFLGVEVNSCPGCGEINPKKPHFRTLKKRVNPCAGLRPITRAESVERWVRVGEFVPSTKGILAYQALKKHQSYFVGRGPDKRPTTDETALHKLIGKYPQDPLYPLVLRDRELTKLLGTYIGYTVEDGA